MTWIPTLVIVASLAAQQTAPAAACHEWHECRRLALEAYARGEYEHFHDLAWRTVQTGPPRDPDLMYLLARAQSLSGRPHDSLVMLRRLAEVGFITAATTDDDFRRVRELRQWAEVEAVIGAVPRTPEVSRPTVAVPSSSEDALRIPGEVVGSAGLAYDRVS